MATKDLGRSAAKFSAGRFFALALSVSPLVVALTATPTYAQASRRARDKMVDLNKQALLSYEAKDYPTAKELLNKALKEAKAAGLDDDKMTARTYVHLGAVYWVGFQDQAGAIQNFTLAKKIRPDIQLTPSIETPDLKSVFDLAVVESEPTPPPQPETQPEPAATATASNDDEPDLPSSMSAPLMCATPEEAPPSRAINIRCALRPGVNGKSVQLYYRAPSAEKYQSVPMSKSPKGWYLATIPPSAVKGSSLQIYFDARDASDAVVASNGQADSPSIVEIRRKGSYTRGGIDKDDDPMRHIREQQRAEAYKAGLHRRMEGAVWFGMGGGGGWGYAPAGKLEWERDIQVSAITTTTGAYHLLPEIGYMWTDNFAIAVQGRIEFIQQQQAYYINPNTNQPELAYTGRRGSPTTKAFAVLARAIWYTDVTSSGNLQFLFSGDAGGGFIRFPVKPVAVVESTDPDTGAVKINDSKTIAKTDTRPIGPFLAGASAGFIYHVHRHFALSLEGRAITGLNNFGVVLEGGLNVQLAFGGGAPPPKTGDDEDEEDDFDGSGADRPEPASSDAPSSSDSDSDSDLPDEDF
jgi:hypothetical protein